MQLSGLADGASVLVFVVVGAVVFKACAAGLPALREGELPLWGFTTARHVAYTASDMSFMTYIAVRVSIWAAASSGKLKFAASLASSSSGSYLCPTVSIQLLQLLLTPTESRAATPSQVPRACTYRR